MLLRKPTHWNVSLTPAGRSAEAECGCPLAGRPSRLPRDGLHPSVSPNVNMVVDADPDIHYTAVVRVASVS